MPPSTPAASKPALFDADHRRQTLLTMAAALAGGRNLGESIANVTSGLAGLNGALSTEQRKSRELGGPDNSFEIITDPKTGERTYQPVKPLQDYIKDKAMKPKDVADMNGRAMFSILQMPEADREAAYAGVLANPEHYGVDRASLPPTYDPTYAALTSGMGMTVSQAMIRKRAEESGALDAEYQRWKMANGAEQTKIAGKRAEAQIRQGDERVRIARERGAPKGRRVKAGHVPSDLTYLLN